VVAPTISARTKGGGGLGTDFDCDGGLVAGTMKGSHDRIRSDESLQLVTHALRAEGFDASEDGTGRGIPMIVGALSDGAHMGGGLNGQDAYSGRIIPVSECRRDGADRLRIAGTQRADRPDHTNNLRQEMQVRRLTPKECARLQGFPDTYLDITYRGKPAADGPKYKALGNSMAVPVMNWIGRRIQMVQEIKP
jgi:DNA (cytosine-5)-methyltransferase 1